MTHVHRKRWQKPIFSDAFECPKCRAKLYRYKRPFSLFYRQLSFIFSRYAVCARCGSGQIRQLEKPDRLDPFTKTPLALLQRLLGAPIRKCSPCRLQYYDWRPIRPQSPL